MMTFEDRQLRYLRICAWAQKRYIVNGCIVLWMNGGRVLSKYSEIEKAAWNKYLNF